MGSRIKFLLAAFFVVGWCNFAAADTSTGENNSKPVDPAKGAADGIVRQVLPSQMLHGSAAADVPLCPSPYAQKTTGNAPYTSRTQTACQFLLVNMSHGRNLPQFGGSSIPLANKAASSANGMGQVNVSIGGTQQWSDYYQGNADRANQQIQSYSNVGTPLIPISKNDSSCSGDTNCDDSDKDVIYNAQGNKKQFYSTTYTSNKQAVEAGACHLVAAKPGASNAFTVTSHWDGTYKVNSGLSDSSNSSTNTLTTDNSASNADASVRPSNSKDRGSSMKVVVSALRNPNPFYPLVETGWVPSISPSYVLANSPSQDTDNKNPGVGVNDYSLTYVCGKKIMKYALTPNNNHEAWYHGYDYYKVPIEDKKGNILASITSFSGAANGTANYKSMSKSDFMNLGSPPTASPNMRLETFAVGFNSCWPVFYIPCYALSEGTASQKCGQMATQTCESIMCRQTILPAVTPINDLQMAYNLAPDGKDGAKDGDFITSSKDNLPFITQENMAGYSPFSALKAIGTAAMGAISSISNLSSSGSSSGSGSFSGSFTGSFGGSSSGTSSAGSSGTSSLSSLSNLTSLSGIGMSMGDYQQLAKSISQASNGNSSSSGSGGGMDLSSIMGGMSGSMDITAMLKTGGGGLTGKLTDSLGNIKGYATIAGGASCSTSGGSTSGIAGAATGAGGAGTGGLGGGVGVGLGGALNSVMGGLADVRNAIPNGANMPTYTTSPMTLFYAWRNANIFMYTGYELPALAFNSTGMPASKGVMDQLMQNGQITAPSSQYYDNLQKLRPWQTTIVSSDTYSPMEDNENAQGVHNLLTGQYGGQSEFRMHIANCISHAHLNCDCTAKVLANGTPMGYALEKSGFKQSLASNPNNFTQTDSPIQDPNASQDDARDRFVMTQNNDNNVNIPRNLPVGVGKYVFQGSPEFLAANPKLFGAPLTGLSNADTGDIIILDTTATSIGVNVGGAATGGLTGASGLGGALGGGAGGGAGGSGSSCLIGSSGGVGTNVKTTTAVNSNTTVNPNLNVKLNASLNLNLGDPKRKVVAYVEQKRADGCLSVSSRGDGGVLDSYGVPVDTYNVVSTRVICPPGGGSSTTTSSSSGSGSSLVGFSFSGLPAASGGNPSCTIGSTYTCNDDAWGSYTVYKAGSDTRALDPLTGKCSGQGC